MKKIFIVFLSFYIFLIVFIPKENIYYSFEKALFQFNISLNNEIQTNDFLDFKVNEANLQFEEIEIGIVETISLKTLLFYNTFEAKNIVFISDVRDFLPKKIENIKLSQSILKPTQISFDALGDFGRMDGFIDIKTKQLYIKLNLAQNANIKYKPMLKKFRYENNLWIYDEILK